jgi:predicted XRE-type DNA-binding protein
MREGLGEAAYNDAVKQLAGQGKPWERRPLLEEPEGGGETQAERNPPIAGGKQPEQWRNAGDAFKKPGAESAAMEKAGIDPQSGKPRETKRDIERRLREQARAGFETPAQKQPEPIEGTNPWKSLVKQKAAEWDMQPQDFHSLAKDLHKELTEHLGQREAAKQAAREKAHLTQADINRLENKGFDSGSKHKRIKALDTIGRELASQYPALGWGRGREEESGEDSGFDYAEHLWDLIREGAKKVPSPTSPEFMEHVEEFLRHQLKSHGSSGVAGGHAAEGEDLSAVPFSKVRRGIVRRYSKWLKSADRLLSRV